MARQTPASLIPFQPVTADQKKKKKGKKIHVSEPARADHTIPTRPNGQMVVISQMKDLN